MKRIRRTLIYIKRHFDFLLVDLVAFSLAYYASVWIRRSLKIPIYHSELFMEYGIVCIIIYFAIELLNQNLNGILSRNFPKEAKVVLLQQMSTWSVYTVFLFMIKEAHLFSRAIYVTAFFMCSLVVLIARSLWKYISKMHERSAEKLLIVCESGRAQSVLSRVLPGTFENEYDICAVVMNGKGEADYHDWYPHAEGLEHISDFLPDHKLQAAYVELDDPDEEAETIELLLNAGIVVHRSLGGSRLNYAGQYIDDLSGLSVITIDGTETSLVSRANKFWNRLKSALVYRDNQ
ncbi:MAG: hypothetical protein J6P87_06900 [Lachnospiraceae bacterium]|nr:hypothetical protein [Lachnospiraceae bacterium]